MKFERIRDVRIDGHYLAAAARRVEAAKYSAASIGRDEVIARREATTRGREVAAKKKAVRAAEVGTHLFTRHVFG